MYSNKTSSFHPFLFSTFVCSILNLDPCNFRIQLSGIDLLRCKKSSNLKFQHQYFNNFHFFYKPDTQYLIVKDKNNATVASFHLCSLVQYDIVNFLSLLDYKLWWTPSPEFYDVCCVLWEIQTVSYNYSSWCWLFSVSEVRTVINPDIGSCNIPLLLVMFWEGGANNEKGADV